MTTRRDNLWQILWSTGAATSVLRILALALLATLLIGPASAVEERSEFVEVHLAALRQALADQSAATEANQQQRLRDLAEIVLKGLDDYREQLSILPLEGLATASEALLDLRDATAAGGGYVDLLVVDALNRMLFVELTKRLVLLGSAPPELEAAVDRLADYEIAPRKLVAMAEEELGRAVPGVDEARADSGARGVFYHLLQNVGGDLAHLAGLRSAEELAASTVYQLLESPNLARLLTRYWQTDYGIHIRLPLLARYLRESGGGVERYDYEHVRKTLGLSSRQVRQSYDSTINRTRRTAVSGVLGLVEEVRSGGIDAFVAFGDGGVGDRWVEATQQVPPTEPYLTCELTHEDDWGRAADGTIRISNLVPIQLLVELRTGGAKVEPLEVEDQWNPEDATVKVEVYAVGGEEREAVPVKLSRTGGGGSRDLQQLDLWLDIPVSEDAWNAELDEFLIDAREMLQREGLLDEFERLTANPEVLSVAFRDRGTWNRPGRFEVQCNYESDTEGLWNGDLQAEPLVLDVVDDGTVFDKLLPPDEEEP